MRKIFFLFLPFLAILNISFIKDKENGLLNSKSIIDTLDCEKKIDHYMSKNDKKKYNIQKSYFVIDNHLNKKNFTSLDTVKILLNEIKKRYEMEGVDLVCRNSCHIIANFINIFLDSCGYYTKKICVNNTKTDKVYSNLLSTSWKYHIAPLVLIHNQEYVIDFPSSGGDSTNFVLPRDKWEKRSIVEDSNNVFTIVNSDILHAIVGFDLIKGVKFIDLKGNSTLKEFINHDIHENWKNGLNAPTIESFSPLNNILFEKDEKNSPFPIIKPNNDPKEKIKPNIILKTEIK